MTLPCDREVRQARGGVDRRSGSWVGRRVG